MEGNLITSDNNASLGKYLRTLRKEKHIHQEQMVEAIGVKRVTISAYENDRITPSPEMVVRIADFLESHLIIRNKIYTCLKDEVKENGQKENAETIIGGAQA